MYKGSILFGSAFSLLIISFLIKFVFNVKLLVSLKSISMVYKCKRFNAIKKTNKQTLV